MDTVLPLDRMTVEEKLRVMEALWADLSRKADSLESPAWHADVLRERDQRVSDGKETYLHWEDAKRELRNRLFPFSRSKENKRSACFHARKQALTRPAAGARPRAATAAPRDDLPPAG